MHFQRISPDSIDEHMLENFKDRNIHQSPQWIDFIATTQNAEPVYANLMDKGSILGFFTGLIVTKFGFKILGSPFPGWSTTFMGFNLLPGIDIPAVLRSLEAFCFNDLECDHLEIMDRRINVSIAEQFRYQIWNYETFEIDLTQTEDEIFRKMKHSCRGCIRKAIKSGIRIVEAQDESFANEYYEQIVHVFEVKGYPPPFQLERVQILLEKLLPTGRLLLLRAVDANGICIATGIFPAMNGVAYAWGSASWRHFSAVRPNEAIFWYAFKYWKQYGMHTFDLVGAADYKMKYGGKRVTVPWIRKSRNWRTAALRQLAETVLLKYPRLTQLIRS